LYNFGGRVSLENILAYSKLRRALYTFISPLDFKHMGLTSRSLHYICSKTVKK
jgi:hypothetical protein